MGNLNLNKDFVEELGNVKSEALKNFKEVCNKHFKGCLFSSGDYGNMDSNRYFDSIFLEFDNNGECNHRKLFQMCFNGEDYIQIENKICNETPFGMNKIRIIKDNLFYTLDFENLTIANTTILGDSGYNYDSLKDELNDESKDLIKKYREAI